MALLIAAEHWGIGELKQVKREPQSRFYRAFNPGELTADAEDWDALAEKVRLPSS